MPMRVIRRIHPDAQVGPAAPPDGALLLDATDDVLALVLDLVGHAHLVEDRPHLLAAVPVGEPARGLREQMDADPQADGRQGRDGEHPPPHAGLRPDGRDDRIAGVGEQLARDDHELVARDHRAADLHRRHLRQVDGHGGRGAAHGEAEDEPEDDEHLPVGGEGAAEGADEEDDGHRHDAPPAPEAVGQPAADERAEGGADGQPGRHEGLVEGGQSETAGLARLLQEWQGAGDHAGVVAEEQAAEGGDRADGEQAPVDPALLVAGGRGRAAHVRSSRVNAAMKSSRAAFESPAAKASMPTTPS